VTELVKIELADGIRVVTMNRPDKKNALTQDMYAAMADAVATADEDPAVRVVVITGEGDIFTSGNDLNDFLAAGVEDANAPVWLFLRAMATTKTPVIAAVNGAGIGIGTTMLLHCDFAYASEGAKFHMPFINLALVPEAASSLLLPRCAGYRKAAELLMLGEPFDASEALASGVITAIASGSSQMEMAMETARKLVTKPPSALRQTKALLRGEGQSVMERFKTEADDFSVCLKSPEAKEALTAFFERRPPDYSKFS
jgi:enoyl-CoA hydratase/carnithine racemase